MRAKKTGSRWQRVLALAGVISVAVIASWAMIERLPERIALVVVWPTRATDVREASASPPVGAARPVAIALARLPLPTKTVPGAPATPSVIVTIVPSEPSASAIPTPALFAETVATPSVGSGSPADLQSVRHRAADHLTDVPVVPAADTAPPPRRPVVAPPPPEPATRALPPPTATAASPPPSTGVGGPSPAPHPIPPPAPPPPSKPPPPPPPPPTAVKPPRPPPSPSAGVQPTPPAGQSSKNHGDAKQGGQGPAPGGQRHDSPPHASTGGRGGGQTNTRAQTGHSAGSDRGGHPPNDHAPPSRGRGPDHPPGQTGRKRG